MLNKKATEKVMSGWFFVLIVLIVSGVVLILYNYLSLPIDSRIIESQIGSGVILECISENGFIKEFVFDENFDLSFCGMGLSILDSGLFYVKINVIDSSGDLMREYTIGEDGYEKDCEVMRGKIAKSYPACDYTSEYFYYFNSTSKVVEKIKIELLFATNNVGERVINVKQ